MLAGHFRVRPRLVEILGGIYRSSEVALKELVANSWDADASRVDIVLPLALSGQPVVIRDNGQGMSPDELRTQYLDVAVDRRRAFGPTTARGRQVRGHRGIGKFAGFLLANCMTVSTVSQGIRSRFVLEKDDLVDGAESLESLSLPIETEPCGELPGTIIELSQLRSGFEQPSPKKLGSILLREFALSDDFAISIDNVPLTPDVLAGKKVQFELPLESGDKVEVTAWLAPGERDFAEHGFAVRVDGRAVGAPSNFGLDDDSDVPRSALRRMYVEVQADHLRDHVLPNWSGVVENSSAYQEVQREVSAAMRKQLSEWLEGEPPETEQQFVERYAQQLELLPLTRREQARQALLRVFKKLFAETPKRKQIVAELVLNVFELDRYWLFAQRLDEIDPADLIKLADVLQEWGLGDVAEVATRAKQRLRFLDQFERLVTAAETREFKGIHPVLEASPWILGDEFELWVSNKTLRRIVRDRADKEYRDSNGKKRPDLILVGLRDSRLLVELKGPTYEVTWQDVAQAKEYRDSLQMYLPREEFSVLVLGGTVAAQMARDGDSALASTYSEVIDHARVRLRWLIENLDQEVRQAGSSPQDRLDL